MKKLKVALLFGGCSEEHDISVKSAMEIDKCMDKNKYEVFYIGITKKGEWKLCKQPEPDWEAKNDTKAILSPDRRTHGLLILKENTVQVQPIDVIFPAMHGKMGEDGSIQGLFELSSIPYAGCKIAASALCMDKSLAFSVVRRNAIHTPDFCVYFEGDEPDEAALSYPVFVKPARSGSSFGVSKVTCKEELAKAVCEARKYDSKIIIEEAIEGLEVGCAVLGSENELTVGEVDEICLSHGFFRIHQEAKPEQGSENATILVPADIASRLQDKVKETAKKIYRALGCEGLARVDLFLQEDETVVLNEVNTLPGCTVYSRYPRMMKAAGISMTKVIDKAIELAIKG